MFDSFKSWLGLKIAEVVQWFNDFFIWLGTSLWSSILDGLATAFEAIPVPGFILEASGAFSHVGGTVLFFAQKFAVGEGIALILSAYVLRFILRRIPLIG
jgi:hypothetical protein